MSRDRWQSMSITHLVEGFIPPFHVTGTHTIGLDGCGAEKEVGNGSSKLVGFLDFDSPAQKKLRTFPSHVVVVAPPCVPPETSQIFPSGLAQEELGCADVFPYG